MTTDAPLNAPAALIPIIETRFQQSQPAQLPEHAALALKVGRVQGDRTDAPQGLGNRAGRGGDNT